jgi:hypothetical protein
MTSAKAISIVPISHRLRAPVSIWSSNAKPSTPIGSVATIRYQPMRTSCVPRNSGRQSDLTHDEAMCQRSRRK